MNRLQIILKYTTLQMKLKNRKKYNQSQKLLKKITKINDKKIFKGLER